MKKLSLCIAAVALLTGGPADARSYKRGVSENMFQYIPQMEVLAPGVSWYYNWATTEGRNVESQEFMEFVPMCWNGVNAEAIRTYVKAHPDTKYILGFNEPNFKAQANLTPQQAAEKWPELQALAKELNLKIVAPALNYSPDAPYNDPTKWMDEFVNLVGKDAFDFVAIHNYGGYGVLVDLATRFHDKYQKPVWVTEFCYWPGEMGDVTVASQVSSMIESVEWLEKTEWIYRYAWFKATENSRANFKLVESGRGDDPRELTEAGAVYVYMSSFDENEYHPVNSTVAATQYANRKFASLGKGANPDCPLPIEVSAFTAGATLDYQFDVPSSGNYNLELIVSGVGEPARFDPKISVVAVSEDGNDGKELSAAQQFSLTGDDAKYMAVRFPLSLNSGKQTIRIKDMNPYAPSGIRISTVRLADAAAIDDLLMTEENTNVDVVNLQGVIVRRGVDSSAALEGLPAGIYLVGGRKVYIK